LPQGDIFGHGFGHGRQSASISTNHHAKALIPSYSKASNQYPLDFIERELIIAAIVKAGGPGALVGRKRGQQLS
jgi:hypothetical protein